MLQLHESFPIIFSLRTEVFYVGSNGLNRMTDRKMKTYVETVSFVFNTY